MFRLNGHTSCVLLMVTAGALASAQAPRATPTDIARSVDSLAARVVTSGLSPALGVAIVMDGKTIFTKAYGFADATNRVAANDQTLWYLASTSKSFTGFGVSLLSHQGVLRFDAPISTLLPDVKWPVSIDAAQLTLAQFLSHTHHINDNAFVQNAAFTGVLPEPRWGELVQYLGPTGNQDLVYSNFGYNIAAMVIDRKRPDGWRRFLDSAVYRPAGLRETYARVSGLDARRIAKPHVMVTSGGFTTLKFEKTDATMNSAGGHLSTLRDLARWTIVQMDSGRIDGKQVFPKEAVELSHRLIARHTVESSKRFGPFARDGWGAGWDIGSYEGEPMVSRFGGYSSIRSHLSFLPARRIGVVAQVNGPGAGGATDVLAALAYDLEAGRPNARAAATERLDEIVRRLPAARQRLAAADSVRRARQRPLGHPIADFAGSYHDDAFGSLVFSVSGNSLRFRWGVLEGPVEVYDADKNQLRIEVAGSAQIVGFNFDTAGPANSIDVSGTILRRR